MASLLQQVFILFLFTINHFLPAAQSHQRFLLNLTKDLQTQQYTTQLLIGTPQLPTKLVLHLSGHSLWLNCPPSSRALITYNSLQCLMAKSNGQKTSSISSNLCHVHQQNPITGVTNIGDLAQDIVNVNGITVDNFLFSCSPEYLVNGLVNGAKGVLGFGRSKIGFYSQMVNSFDLPRTFTVCLSSSQGFIISGNGIYKSISYYYTPLVSSMSTHGYYVNVNWIKVNGRRLVVEQPIGGVEISSSVPYTVVKSSLYEVLRKSFVTAASAMNMSLVSPVAPFGACFRSQAIVPEIELVMQSELVKWRIQRRNLMVEVSDSVMCLGFVDGGLGMTASMILGGHQLEDHMLEFDLGTGMMGFSSSLLIEGESCSNIGASGSTLRESL